jgi:hypothetical protein
MTDDPARDHEERIRRLQERRAASSGTRGGTVALGPAKSARPARRQHPAAATRWLLGGLSIASFFTIAGTVAVADQARLDRAASVSSVSSTPAAPTSATPAPSASTTSRTTAAPAPHTVTRGS